MTQLRYLLLVCCVVIGSSCDRSPDSAAQPGASTSSAARLDPAKVPADLRHLVPVVQEWGIGDGVDRDEKIDRSTPAERESLRAAIGPHQARITEWLDSFPEGKMTDEAGAFMYAQLAIEEMPK